MAESFGYTEEYLEAKNYERLAAQRKYVKTGLRHLMKHIKEDEYLHPSQIKFIVRSILKIALYFEDQALKTYNDLPEHTREEIDTAYFNKQYINDGSEQIDTFYKKQEELNVTTREEAKKYIEENESRSTNY